MSELLGSSCLPVSRSIISSWGVCVSSRRAVLISAMAARIFGVFVAKSAGLDAGVFGDKREIGQQVVFQQRVIVVHISVIVINGIREPFFVDSPCHGLAGVTVDLGDDDAYVIGVLNQVDGGNRFLYGACECLFFYSSVEQGRQVALYDVVSFFACGAVVDVASCQHGEVFAFGNPPSSTRERRMIGRPARPM